jgi:transposase
MREITMSIDEQRRTMVLTRIVAGSVSMAEAVALLGLSERSVWRLKRRFLADGPAGLVHGNRGRPSARRLGDADRARILELAGGRFAGANDSHLVDLLADEGLVVSRATVQRILRAAGRPSPRHRRPPRHRSRRDRMAQAGLLLQLDGSRHDWLEARGPRLTLVGAIDDATGILTGATFRDQEDVAGYLEILRDTVRRHGVPAAVYHDRIGTSPSSTATCSSSSPTPGILSWLRCARSSRPRSVRAWSESSSTSRGRTPCVPASRPRGRSTFSVRCR